MKILSPKEYKKQNKYAYLNDYIAYLEEKQQEIESVIEYAKSFSLDTALTDLEKQSEEIMNLLIIMEQYMKEIVLNSIDRLSLQELQSYFDSSNDFASRRKKEKDKKEKLNKKLEIINERIEKNLYENGRKKEFYEVGDVEEFFKENISPEQFLENLLVFNLPDTLENDFKEVVNMECKDQKITLTEEEIDDLWLEFLALLEKCKKILCYVEESKEQLVETILSEKGLGKIFSSIFGMNTGTDIIQDLLNLSKIHTKFYQGLPVSLQERLLFERFYGSIYAGLYETYQSIKNGEELKENSFNEGELQKKAKIEKLLKGVEYALTCIDAEEKSHYDFLSNREMMSLVLKANMITFFKENQISLDFVNEIIGDISSALENYRLELLQKRDLFSSKTRNLKMAQEILLNPKYHSFFEDVELLNKRKLYCAMGVNATERVIEPFLIEEKRRFEQIYIMTSMQKELERIYAMINEKKQFSNFITKILPSYKEELRKLDFDYIEEIEKSFHKLQEKNLFQVNTPRIKSDIALGTVEVLPSKGLVTNIRTFDELCDLPQTFWNMSIGIDKNTQNRFLADNPEFENWSDYVNSLMKLQRVLTYSLFNFSIDSAGYYHFDISQDEREELLRVQARIVAIADFACKERKRFKQEMEETEICLDPVLVSRLEQILGKNSNLSRESLALYIENTKQEIYELSIYLLKHQEDCRKFGIELPKMKEEVVESSVSKYDELESRIKLLHIDGITTLEEAKSYRNLLLELNEYIMPEEDVKKFYLENRKGQ